MAVFAVQRETAGFREGVEFSVGLGLLELVNFFNMLAFSLEILAIQALRNFFFQRLAHLHHELSQQTSLPWRHAQGPWFFGCIKVVQVTQIRGYRLADGHRLHYLLQQ